MKALLVMPACIAFLSAAVMHWLRPNGQGNFDAVVLGSFVWMATVMLISRYRSNHGRKLAKTETPQL